jgi:RNA polymerase sigma-70 factor, ECF subfamily
MAESRDGQSDEDLARRAALGDRTALDTLLARHLDQIHAICRRVLGHPEDTLDATQEALVAIVRGISRFDGRSRFTTWMYRVATNAALDEARRRSRRPIASEHLPERASVADTTDAVDARLDIDAALSTLSADNRAAVALRDLAGLDYAEIAVVLGIPIGTVRSRIARGRATLADRLADQTGNRDDPTARPSPQTPMTPPP